MNDKFTTGCTPNKSTMNGRRLGGSGRGPLLVKSGEKVAMIFGQIESVEYISSTVLIKTRYNSYEFTLQECEYLTNPEYDRWLVIFISRLVDRIFSSLAETTGGKFDYDYRVLDIVAEYDSSIQDVTDYATNEEI